MSFLVASATASSRAHSEDRLAVHELAGGVVVVVADGAGGMGGGGRAAELAVEYVVRAIGENGALERRAPWWIELLVRADELVASDPQAGETTIVAVHIAHDGSVVGASCGDSGATIFGVDGATDELTEGQHRKRIGSRRASPTAFERSALTGTLVLATDGLFAYGSLELLARIVREHEDLEQAAKALVHAVRLPSGGLRDDVVTALVRPQELV